MSSGGRQIPFRQVLQGSTSRVRLRDLRVEEPGLWLEIPRDGGPAVTCSFVGVVRVLLFPPLHPDAGGGHWADCAPQDSVVEVAYSDDDRLHARRALGPDGQYAQTRLFAFRVQDGVVGVQAAAVVVDGSPP